MNYYPINDAWQMPESLRTKKHPAHVKQEKLLKERKAFDEFKKKMTYQAPSYPWTDVSRDRYLNGYYPPPEPELHPDKSIPWGSPFRFWKPHGKEAWGQEFNHQKMMKPMPSRTRYHFPVEGFANMGEASHTDLLMCFIFFILGLVCGITLTLLVKSSK